MWLQLSQFKTLLDFDESGLAKLVAQSLKLPEAAIRDLAIRRKSLDARKEPVFVYTLVFQVEYSPYELEALLVKTANLEVYEPQALPALAQCTPVARQFRPVIIGAGPAGLFAGFRLAVAGWQPIILERGDGLEDRVAKVTRFWDRGELDPESNIQYGIGGAGTFSDGKLTTRIKDPRIQVILDTLIDFGAPPEIRYWQYPHIGTDLLRQVVAGLERFIVERGGMVRFRACLTDLTYQNGQPIRIRINQQEEVETDRLVLATGNSARDVYRLLGKKGIPLTAKQFAVGLRIEHPQDLIDRAQYGRWAGHVKLGAAEYHLTHQHAASGRGVYSFCMCPGGRVIGAASTPGGVVTNGMSFHARDSGLANAAIIATVNEADYGAGSVFAGMEFQEALEQRAFTCGGGGFKAPAQRVGDFIKRQPTTTFGPLKPSYLPGVKPADLWELLPAGIAAAIADGLGAFGRKVKGFDWADAVLTGVETRTSAPVRIVRDDRREAPGFPGIYPVGEGAGYAGGIVSSALDGWKTAEAILEQLNCSGE